jgi:hypothetical protein
LHCAPRPPKLLPARACSRAPQPPALHSERVRSRPTRTDERIADNCCLLGVAMAHRINDGKSCLALRQVIAEILSCLRRSPE